MLALHRAQKARNAELFSLREADEERWTFKALGEKYGITDVRACQIYHNELCKRNWAKYAATQQP
jgi:hypothetical protein